MVHANYRKDKKYEFEKQIFFFKKKYKLSILFCIFAIWNGICEELIIDYIVINQHKNK